MWPTGWSSLLDGALAETAREATRVIAEALRAAELAPDLVPGGEAELASLAGGRAGLAIFYAYLTQARLADEGEVAQHLLDEAIDTVATRAMPPSLYSGFTGVAWATAHLEGRLFGSDGEDPNEAIDAALIQYLDQLPWGGDYDLVNGLVGFGVYALERLPRRSAREILTRLLDRLEEAAERSDQGYAWLTQRDLLPSWQREERSKSYYDLGMAHGVPGVIALLGGVCAAGVAPAKAQPLLDQAVRWLLAQRLPSSAGSSFSSGAGPGIERGASRSAWCYGDPGIAAGLLCAARSVGEPAWEREAVALARRAAERPPDKAGVRDAGLCHGAAGLGHLFNRMFQATGDPQLSRAARFWLARALEMRKPGGGIAGFTALNVTEERQEMWTSDPGILTGAAGIALALLAATTAVEPAWDRMLLVSIPDLVSS